MPNNVSRKQVQAERKARLEAMRKEQRRRERRSTLLVVGGSALVGALLVGAVGFSLATRHSGHKAKPQHVSVAPPAPTGKPLKASAGTPDTKKTSAIAGVSFWTGLARDHVQTPVTYAQTPPVGGQHNPVWLNCGIYTQPVPSENAVHDLEHGAVWITYRPDLPADQLASLTKLVNSYGKSSETDPKPGYVDLTPFPGLPSPVVISAWGVQLKVDSAGDPRIKKFIDTYRHGPQTPEQGAACTGGTGTPLDPSS